jgi:hypothetical protein
MFHLKYVGYNNRKYKASYGTSTQVQNCVISTRLLCTLFKPATGKFCYLYGNRIVNAEGGTKALGKVRRTFKFTWKASSASLRIWSISNIKKSVNSEEENYSYWYILLQSYKFL